MSTKGQDALIQDALANQRPIAINGTIGRITAITKNEITMRTAAGGTAIFDPGLIHTVNT